MGKWISAEEIKSLTTNPSLKMLSLEQIELMYVEPAERRLDEFYGMDLETNRLDPPYPGVVPEDIPTKRHEEFRLYPHRKVMFYKDCKLSVLLLIQRMAVNPDGYLSQSISGASAEFGNTMPAEIGNLMRRWFIPNRTVFRA